MMARSVQGNPKKANNSIAAPHVLNDLSRGAALHFFMKVNVMFAENHDEYQDRMDHEAMLETVRGLDKCQCCGGLEPRVHRRQFINICEGCLM